MDTRIERAIAHMQAHLARPLSVRELAETAGLSVAQFTRIFRQATGRTPGAFLCTLRLARARILLERTSLTITDVMMQVGISDRGHFARQFRREYGECPRTLRLQLRSAHTRTRSG